VVQNMVKKNAPETPIKERHASLVERGKHTNVAKVACGNSLLNAVHAMLTRKEAYRAENEELTKAKMRRMKRKARVYKVREVEVEQGVESLMEGGEMEAQAFS